jgi:hypothetical protein
MSVRSTPPLPKRRSNRVAIRLVCCVTLLLFCVIANAQGNGSAISGMLRDPTGSPLEGASLSATQVERNLTYRTQSTSAGVFHLEGLPSGTYNVEAIKDGFSRFRQTGLVILSNDHLGLNITLRLGLVEQQVLVTDAPPIVQTQDAMNSTVLQNQAIEQLPVAGRNLFQLEFSLSGVSKASATWGRFWLYSVSNVNNISIGGGLPQENEITIDGATDTLGTRGVAYIPPVAATQEMVVRINQYDASIGRLGGGLTSFALRSGTSHLHGQLFEFFENSAFDANTWQANRNNSPLPHTNNHQFGFEVAGPVPLPGLRGDRRRLFFMLTLEALRYSGTSSAQATVPTLAMRSGDFSSLTDALGKPITIYDPLTVTQSPAGTLQRTAFPRNRIPSARLNPIALAAAAYYPAPNQPGGLNGVNNFSSTLPSINRYNAWVARTDFITGPHTITLRYGQTPWYNQAQLVWGSNAAEPSKQNPSTRTERSGNLGWTAILSPTALFRLSAAFNRYETTGGNTYGDGFNPASLGFSSDTLSAMQHLQFPYFNLGTIYSPLGAIYSRNAETLTGYATESSIAWLTGRHSLHVGVELRRYEHALNSPGASSGEYDFSRSWTQASPFVSDSSSGNEVASFLLGNLSGGYLPRAIAPFYRNHYAAGYLQDDFKILPNLTLNFGLRWDYESPARERYNRQVVGFGFSSASPLAGAVAGASGCSACSNLKGGLLYSGIDGNPASPFRHYFTNVGPRFGVAYAVTPRTVLRGGYGLSYLGQDATGPTTGFSSSTTFSTTLDGGITPRCTLSNPLCGGVQTPVGNSLGLATYQGQVVTAPFYHRPLPFAQQMSAGIQQELPGHWLVELSYVGNLTSRLPVPLSLNVLPRSTLLQQSAPARAAYFTTPVANPFAGLLPNSSLNAVTVPRQQLLYPYPQYSAVTITDVPIGTRRYDALQTHIFRPYNNGLTLNLNWTYSRTMERTAVRNASDVQIDHLSASMLEERIAQFDSSHIVSAVITYELPFGRERHMLANMSRAADSLAGGWNLSGSFTTRTGFPIDGATACPISNPTPRQPISNIAIDPVLNREAFPTTALNGYDIRPCSTRIADVRFPRLLTTDLSIAKQFAIYKPFQWQIRADIFNTFNHPYFTTLLSNDVSNANFGLLNPTQNNDPRVINLAVKLRF